jgi:hypothetical protein
MSMMNARSPFAILGAIVLASSLGSAGSARAADGQPATQMQAAAAADEQAVLDIFAAEIDVTHGRRAARSPMNQSAVPGDPAADSAGS